MNFNNFTIKAQEAVQEAVEPGTKPWTAGHRARACTSKRDESR